MPYLGTCTILLTSVICTDNRVFALPDSCKWIDEKNHEFECDMKLAFGYQCISPDDYASQQDAIEKKIMEIGSLKRELEDCKRSN
jgi:hypothetical protein